MKMKVLLILISFLSLLSCSEKQISSYPTITVEEKFSWPARLAKGSTANQAYLDFEEWLNGLDGQANEVGLRFSSDLGIWAYWQCTMDLWKLGCKEVHLSIGEGDSHLVVKPLHRGEVIALAVFDGTGLDGIRVLDAFTFGHSIDSFVVDGGPEDVGGRTPGAGEIAKLANASSVSAPLHIFINRDLSMSRLDNVLTALEEIGANAVAVIFYVS